MSNLRPAKPLPLQPGDIFGRLTVLRHVGSCPRKKCRMWLCRCDCGSEAVVAAHSLKSKNKRSCGCLPRSLPRHGHARDLAEVSPTYVSWQEMKTRCYNSKRRHYDNYGGRGITVCKRWRDSFEAFLADMGERPPGTSIDRLDVNGPYEADNCRWATAKQQRRNQRSIKLYTYRGETKPAVDWLPLSPVSQRAFFWRLANGWRIEDAITLPVGAKRPGATATN